MATIRKGLVVTCHVDDYRCMARFEVNSRREAAALRKHLYTILPPQYRSSVTAYAGTKEQRLQQRADIELKIGYPVAPEIWFAAGEHLPARFEDLQLPPEAVTQWLAERKACMRQKPWWRWILPARV